MLKIIFIILPVIVFAPDFTPDEGESILDLTKAWSEVIENERYHYLPKYLIDFCRGFNIPIEVADKWSMAESSHRPHVISRADAYGRFQVREVWLDCYIRLTGQDRSKIKNVGRVLLNDKTNCYIWAWSVAFWRRQGYTYEQIANIWLFGERGMLSGRWSDEYVRRIFK